MQDSSHHLNLARIRCASGNVLLFANIMAAGGLILANPSPFCSLRFYHCAAQAALILTGSEPQTIKATKVCQAHSLQWNHRGLKFDDFVNNC